MSKLTELLGDKIWPGIVEDNNDPLRIGRAKIRVKYIFDSIPVEDIPWATPSKSIDGKDFKCPDIGKIVNVQFFSGDLYTPEYTTAEHYDYTLQKFLEELNYNEYEGFNALLFDDESQIYRKPGKGIVIDNNKTNININDLGNILLNLRDNKSKIFLGSDDATQSLLLANKFIDWNDTLIDAFTNGGFIGNLGVPVMPSPELINVITQYKIDRNNFLSNHVFVTDNNEIKSQNRNTYNKKGDAWEVFSKNDTSKNNNSNTVVKEYVPEQRPETGRAEIVSGDIPNDVQIDTFKESIPTIDVKSNYNNGEIPLAKMKKSTWLAKNLGNDASYLIYDAAIALDNMMDYLSVQKFDGKQDIVFTDGYRNINRQNALYEKLGNGRVAKPGTSNHGWGLAVDIYWGVRTSMYKDQDKIASAFKHPMYKWFFENGPKFGWFNPLKLRDGNRTDEWWHWEYYGNKQVDLTVIPKYKGEFTVADINNIKYYGGTYA